MSSECRSITLLFLLTIFPVLDLRDSVIKYSHFENTLTSNYTQIPATGKRGDKSSELSHNRNSAKYSTSQAVLSDHDGRLVDKSTLPEHKYRDKTRPVNTDVKTFQGTLEKGNIRGRQLSSTENVNKNLFDQAKFTSESTTEYFNDQDHKSFDGQLNQPGATVETKLISQNAQRNHQDCHVLEDSHLELSDHLASDLSQTTDIKNVRRAYTVMHLPCCKIANSTADCSGCGLICVPTHLPRNITRLLLTNNHISSDGLYAGVFVNYTQLIELWLDSNNITSLPEGVFDRLDHLKFLSLYNNKITLNMELNNSTVFYPLNNTLETLILNRNTNVENKEYLIYPDLALSVLKKLSRLHIDGLRHGDFGIGFKNLTKLTNLTLAGFQNCFCNMISIRNDTFSYLPHLIFLNISNCYLNGSLIESNAFSNLSKLRVLDVSHNDNLGIHAIGQFMYGQRKNINLVHLIMNHIVSRYTPCVIIYNNTLTYFKHTGLQMIEAMNNEIEMIELGALDMLPPTLEILNLKGNRIMFGAYWQEMASLAGLRELHFDGFPYPLSFPSYYPSSKVQCQVDHTDNYIDNLLVTQKLDGEKCICGHGICSSDNKEFILPLPPKLEVLTMHSRSLAYTVNGIRFCPVNNLTSADLSGNTFKHLGGSVTGLNCIRHLNLSSSLVETIGDDFFNNLTSLEHLNLFGNLLAYNLSNDIEGKIFDKLTNLKHMNLSLNSLNQLHELVFKGLKNLETLDLSRNVLSHVNFSIKHMRKLRYLDLHDNNICYLPRDFRDAIDELLRANNSVKIDMSDNHIYCDCFNLEFIEWMVVNREVFGDNYTNYYCKYRIKKSSPVHTIRGYKDELDRLRPECSTHVILNVTVIGGTLLFLTIIIGLLFYRFRWTLRYWYHAAKMKIYYSPHQVNEEYEYDAFVSYASEDVDFVLQELSPHLSGERHLKLMIHGEKFQAGRHITDNIYMAVRQCRKTLVLVTRQMLASHWCTYELQMARMESISRGREVLVFLFLEEIPTNLMKVDVMSYIKSSTFIRYPKAVQHRKAFWNKLADDLRAQ